MKMTIVIIMMAVMTIVNKDNYVHLHQGALVTKSKVTDQSVLIVC